MNTCATCQNFKDGYCQALFDSQEGNIPVGLEDGCTMKFIPIVVAPFVQS